MGVVMRPTAMRMPAFLVVLLVVAPLALAAPAAASPAKPHAAVATQTGSSPCTTVYVLRHGTKVVTVRGTRVIRVRVRRHGRLVWVRRRVLYRHRKRVVYSFRVAETQCPPPAPTASLTISTSTLPSGGGSFALTFSATNASSCALASSPDLWAGSNPSIGCDGTYQATVGATGTQRSWTFTFIAIGPAGQQATAVQILTEQAPATVSPAPPASPEQEAVATYAALQQSLYEPAASLYDGLSSSPCGAYSCLWPFTNATAATLFLLGTPGGSAYATDAAERLVGLTHYADPLEVSPTGALQPPAYESAVAPPLGPGGSTFYDDNGWVGLDLVQYYLLTSNPVALPLAQDAFNFAVSGWDANPSDPCPGGVFWEDVANSQRNVSANGANAELGLELYRLTGDTSDLVWATQMYQWVVTCLSNPDGLYSDHINPDGSIVTTMWSYNQGVMIGAGVLLAEITGSQSYLTQAERTAQAAIGYFGTGPVLESQGPAFNAIYFRNLLLLNTVAPDAAYAADAQSYAATMWAQREGSGLIDPQDGVNGTAPMVEIFSLLAGSPPLP